jgi:hypothetical protein
VLKEEYQRRNPLILDEFLTFHREIENTQAHQSLQDDVVEYLWALHDAS